MYSEQPTPLEIFEEKKKQFITKHAPDFQDVDWTELFKDFIKYADMLDAVVLNQQEEDLPLTQLPEREYEEQCLIEETCAQQRRIVALAYASRLVPEYLLIVSDKRPLSPIFDYHQILLLMREKRYQDVEKLCTMVIRTIDQVDSLEKKQCPLLPHYYKYEDAFVEQYLHPMMTDFTLSEIYYYLGKAKQALNKNTRNFSSGANYLRARTCLVNDLLKDAHAYMRKISSIEMQPAFENLRNFLEFLSNDEDDSNSQSNTRQGAKTFIKGNLRFCRRYSELLTKNKNQHALFSAVLSQVSADRQRSKTSHVKK